MKVTIEIKDEKKLQLIEELRGEKTAKEFIHLCIDASLALADLQRKRVKEAEANGKLMQFAPAKLEFKTLDVAAITAALKDKDPKNPIKIEVGRLVQAYVTELKKYAEKNGDKLPPQLKVNPKAPIERLAFQITANALGEAAKASNKKIATATN